MMLTLARFTGYGFALVNFIFAALQYNDPDASYWIVMYGFAGAACLNFALTLKAQDNTMFLVTALGALALIIISLNGFISGLASITGDWFDHEEGRETFGYLFILITVLDCTVLTFFARRGLAKS